MSFRIEKEAPKKWHVIDTRKRGAGRVVATFKTKAEAEREMAASEADITPVPTPEPVKPVDVAAMERVARMVWARAEAAARKEWKMAGSVGDAPPTPVLDWMNATPRTERKTATVKTANTTRTPEQHETRADHR